MTAEQFRAARAALGLSATRLATLTGVQQPKTVRRWASGERDVPAPVAVLMVAMMESAAVRDYFGVTLASGAEDATDLDA